MFTKMKNLLIFSAPTKADHIVFSHLFRTLMVSTYGYYFTTFLENYKSFFCKKNLTKLQKAENYIIYYKFILNINF